MLDLHERIVMRTDELPAGLRAATSDDALERRPVGQQSPEPFPETKRGLDDELGQVVRQTATGGHGGSLKRLALRPGRGPRTQPAVIDLVERHEHRLAP